MICFCYNFLTEVKKQICTGITLRGLRSQILTCLIYLVLSSKTHGFLILNLQKKVIVEEEPDDIDVYDIGNLWDSPRLLFLNEECGNLIVENLLEILNKRRNQTFHNSP